MREKAWDRIGHLFPQVNLPKERGGGKATVIAWIWARTVPSPDPAFSGAQVPIASSFVLGSKPGKEAWVEPIVDKFSKKISFLVRNGGTKAELSGAKEGNKVGRGNFVCLLSGAAIDVDYVRSQAQEGRLGAQLMAVVAEGPRGRIYLDPVDADSELALSVRAAWKPEGRVPAPSHDVDRLPMYGMPLWGDAFTQRQLTTLNTMVELLPELRSQVIEDVATSNMSVDDIRLAEGGVGSAAYADAICVFMSFVINRSADRGSTICTWDSSPKMEALRNTFARQALPMTWDYAEGNPFSTATGNFLNNVDWVSRVVEKLMPNAFGYVVQHDAQTVEFPDGAVISTDPPYYDNIGYSDLSDFFYSWMRPALRSIYPNLFGILATPKDEELVATPYRHGGKKAAEEFFLSGMRKAIVNMATGTGAEYPAVVYYAFKQSEVAQEGISSTGWATFLQAVVEAGYAVVGTWPLRTEMANRMIASGTNALANSVVLVCRKKETTAEIISRAEFIRALKRELPPAIAELQAANIAPADMPQSAIGPGMGVFSRYKAVLEADDSPMSVKAALQLINRELDEYLGGIQGEFDGDTRFAITWFEQHGMAKGDYGAADNLARARGISVESVKHAGIVESAAGKVRILARDELDNDWEPESDRHLTVWECLQHLVKQHEKDGISHETAVLLKKIEVKAEAVKDLAYCLYDISANKRKDAKEATAYNALIADWTELTRQAAAIHDTSGDRQIPLNI